MLPPDTSRYQQTNPLNLTDEEKAVKSKWLADAEKTYPQAWHNLGPWYLEMIYDVCLRSSNEELNEIMERIKK